MHGSRRDTDSSASVVRGETHVIELELLRSHLRELDDADSFSDAEVALDAIARSIRMPMMAWAPDVARPDFDVHMDQFLRRHGWSEEVLALWWDQRVMLKTPL